jgi:hypothetical protein
MAPGLFAKEVGISRSMLYYRHKQRERDWHTKCLIEEVLREFPSYGHKQSERDWHQQEASTSRDEVVWD